MRQQQLEDEHQATWEQLQAAQTTINTLGHEVSDLRAENAALKAEVAARLESAHMDSCVDWDCWCLKDEDDDFFEDEGPADTRIHTDSFDECWCKENE